MGSWEENVLAGIYDTPMPVSDQMDADDNYVGYVDMDDDDLYDDCDDDL